MTPRFTNPARSRNVAGPRTVADYAYEAVKRDIMLGKLAPGHRIDQDALAEELGCSKIPLRTALERLAVDGLVQNHSYRGTVVSPLTVEELEDLYLVRGPLEKLATELAAEKMDEETIQELYKMVEQQEQTEHDLDSLLELNRAFHMKIYAVAGRPILLQMIDRLWDLSVRYRRVFLQDAGVSRASTREHRHLVDLLAQGKGAEAGEYLLVHNQKTYNKLLTHMMGDAMDQRAVEPGHGLNPMAR